MKRFALSLLALPLLAGGCLETDDSYKELIPVQPGLVIYQFATTQQLLGLQPADAAVRLALLLSERQEGQPLREIAFEGRKLFDVLFDRTMTIEEQEGGVYLFRYTGGASGADFFTRDGVLTLRTGGLALDQTTEDQPWTIDLSGYIALYDMQKIAMTGGTVKLYSRQNGTYAILVDGMRDGSPGVSSDRKQMIWNGSYTLTPPDPGLQYGLSREKTYKLDGTGFGTSFLSLDGGQHNAQFRYEVTGGDYKFYPYITGGEEKCQILGDDYDKTMFPARDVTIRWWVDDNRVLRRSIAYNGSTLQQ